MVSLGELVLAESGGGAEVLQEQRENGERLEEEGRESGVRRRKRRTKNVNKKGAGVDARPREGAEGKVGIP